MNAPDGIGYLTQKHKSSIHLTPKTVRCLSVCSTVCCTEPHEERHFVSLHVCQKMTVNLNRNLGPGSHAVLILTLVQS